MRSGKNVSQDPGQPGQWWRLGAETRSCTSTHSHFVTSNLEPRTSLNTSSSFAHSPRLDHEVMGHLGFRSTARSEGQLATLHLSHAHTRRMSSQTAPHFETLVGTSRHP